MSENLETLLGVRDACCCCLRCPDRLSDMTVGDPSPSDMMAAHFRYRITPLSALKDNPVMVCDDCKSRLAQSWEFFRTVDATQKYLRREAETHSLLDDDDDEMVVKFRSVSHIKTEIPDDVDFVDVQKPSEPDGCRPAWDDVKINTYLQISMKTEDAVVKTQVADDEDRFGDDDDEDDNVPLRMSCVSCRKPFKRKHNLDKHLVKCLSGRKRKKMSYPESAGKAPHRRHEWRMPFSMGPDDLTCKMCDETFRWHRLLMRHMAVHFPNYVCQTCGKCFAFEKALKRHLLVHENLVFTCDVCSKTYNRKENLKKHMRAHSGDSDAAASTYRCKCSHCPEIFTSHYNKVKHLSEVHNDESKKHRCKICSKRFNAASNLQVHIKGTHMLEKKHPCPMCGDMFFCKSGLNRHMLKHSGVKDFKCEVCQKSYGRKQTLKEHMRIHNGDKRFQCEVCERRFTQKCTLMGHMKTHGQGKKDPVQVH